MNEDELRARLRDQVSELPGNAHRNAEVRRRIGVVRRRRAAAVALALVLIALAGAALINRLPGRPDALPTGFTSISDPIAFSGPVNLDPDTTLAMRSRRHLIRVRCENPGTLLLRDYSVIPGATATVECSRPVADGYEGARIIDPASSGGFAFQTAQGFRLEPSSAGRWVLAVLIATAD